MNTTTATRNQMNVELAGAQPGEPTIAQTNLPFDYARKIFRAQVLAHAPVVRTCTHCHRQLPSIQFSCDKSTRDGLSLWCKECQSKARKERFRRIKELKAKESEKANISVTDTTTNNKIEQPMKKETAKPRKRRTAARAANKDAQTFQYLPIGTTVWFIKNNEAFESKISEVNIEISENGVMIAYIIPTDNAGKNVNKIYEMEIGTKLFTTPVSLVNYIMKKYGVTKSKVK